MTDIDLAAPMLDEARTNAAAEHVEDVEPVRRAFEQAGFTDVTVTKVPELADASTPEVIPYVIVGHAAG